MRISVVGLRKSFQPHSGAPVRAIDDVSIDVDHGELLVILGPSGSGKTTLLRCIAGLERADEGEIFLDERPVFSSSRRIWVPPEKRGISMVFQSYALWPHMTVFDNVAYPLRARGVKPTKLRERVRRALELVGCGPYEHRHPGQLSGGQQQRVAVARAIVGESEVVLFDEPLSSVDARVREELRSELVTLQRELGFSSVYITHDQTEATVLGHRVAILANGRIAQVGPPREIYARPNSTFVADFTGAANRLPGVVEGVLDGEADPRVRGRLRVRTSIGTVLTPQADDGLAVGHEVVLVFRPEHCQLVPSNPQPNTNAWQCIIERSSFLGFCTEYVARTQGVPLYVRTTDRQVLEEGAEAWLTVDPEDIRSVAPA